jgi:uncharacterized protein
MTADDGKNAPAANDNAQGAAKRACAICGKPQLAAFKPFCSRRCADIDLNRWLTGSYAIPVADDGPSSDSDER